MKDLIFSYCPHYLIYVKSITVKELNVSFVSIIIECMKILL